MDNGVETVGVILVEIIKTAITFSLCGILLDMCDRILNITGTFF